MTTSELKAKARLWLRNGPAADTPELLQHVTTRMCEELLHGARFDESEIAWLQWALSKR